MNTRPERQRGMSLVLVLLIMLALLLLGAAASDFVLQSERSARGERDRAVAFRAAEAALQDAGAELAGTAQPGRGLMFGAGDAALFALPCAAGLDNPALGLCGAAPDDGPAPWLAVDFLDDGAATARSVPYGRFTGAQLQAGAAGLPARLPRYVIERLRDRAPGADAGTGARAAVYRITAIGFGARPGTQVVLQALWRLPATY